MILSVICCTEWTDVVQVAASLSWLHYPAIDKEWNVDTRPVVEYTKKHRHNSEKNWFGNMFLM